ncbi:VacJ family lipoprotein [Caulobacter segnis]|uniref:VacJ family lipoprotein n=2 Tax=Caulobacter segnis TaxID=88688 RepID=D5VLS0_CAUST|nr:VacJ family lipoprotein [Caulobacter segnis]ADG11443.1 VacJ family lipoprotein [Caulobacter segnis ATCC 21756]AVQ03106.1 VacJ family lipoprotein [Caulobacter segnis]
MPLQPFPVPRSPRPRDRSSASLAPHRASATWAAAAACLSLAACAHAPSSQTAAALPPPAKTAGDPAEKTNRAIFAVNRTVDRAAVAPVARGYSKVMPSPARKGLKNFTSNLKGPHILINDVLQANFRRAGTTSARFAINSTVGVAGLFDVAGRMGMPFHDADMGQTFGRWGVPPGPSLQIPLLGPSNLRDFSGDLIGGALNPATYLTGGAATAVSVVDGVDMVDDRAELLPLTDELQRTSPDYYASLRDKTAEGRAAMVAEAKSGRGKPEGDHKSGAPLLMTPTAPAADPAARP